MKHLALAAAACFMVSACGGTDSLPVQIEAGASAEDSSLIALAASTLAEVCPLLLTYNEHIERVRGEVDESLGFYVDSLGWTKQVNLAVEIADVTSDIPASYRAGGHTCHYEFGGGRSPGMRVSKRPCQALCGLAPRADGRAGVVPLPQLRIIQ